jgi:hypothetical protein
MTAPLFFFYIPLGRGRARESEGEREREAAVSPVVCVCVVVCTMPETGSSHGTLGRWPSPIPRSTCGARALGRKSKSLEINSKPRIEANRRWDPRHKIRSYLQTGVVAR